MGGIVGRLFREFAITLSVAIVVSLVISLTTTPMMCARLMRPQPSKPAGSGRRGGVVARGTRIYERSLRWALEHSFAMIMVLFVIIGLNGYLYLAIPKTFFPQQDTGMIQGGVGADQSMSFAAMTPKLEAFAKMIRDDPAVDTVTASIGSAGGGGGRGPTAQVSVSSSPSGSARFRPMW